MALTTHSRNRMLKELAYYRDNAETLGIPDTRIAGTEGGNIGVFRQGVLNCMQYIEDFGAEGTETIRRLMLRERDRSVLRWNREAHNIGLRVLSTWGVDTPASIEERMAAWTPGKDAWR